MRTRALALAVPALLISTLLSSGNAFSHPHRHVDQQAHLTVGLERAQLVIRIAPSTIDGAAIFDHIDLDRDSSISAAESTVFAAQVLASTRLLVDGATAIFGEAVVAVPSRDIVAQGGGVIELRTSSRYQLNETPSSHRVAFDIDFKAFAETWFIQPFFFDDFVAATTSRAVDRSEAPGRVEVSFRRQSLP